MAIDPYLTLVRIVPFDPVADARTTIYVAAKGDRRITGLNGVVWTPALIEQPELVIRLFNGDFQAPVEPGAASLRLQMGQVRKTYTVADRCNWAGAEVEIYAGQAGDAWPWTSVFKGRVTGFDRRAETLSLTAQVDTEPFEKNVLVDTYGGTGGNEGGSDLEGRPKPLVIGWASNVEPVLIDATNSVYQFSGYGEIEAVTTLYERASAFPASTGNYANYAALVAASIPRGGWGTCLAEGLVRLGAPAYGVITGDVKGHEVAGSTPRLTGAVIDALADIAGVSGSLIESASLTALDAAVPYPINLVLTEQVRWIDVARRLALPCNHQAGISFGGKFFVMGVTLSGTEEFTLDTAGTSEPLVIEAIEREVNPPFFRTTMGAARNWRVQSPDEIAFEAKLNPMGAFSLTTTYREGDIVTLPDQSEWLYVNVTPSSGNAPPGWPATSDAYWEQTAPPALSAGFEDNLAYGSVDEFKAAWSVGGGGVADISRVASDDRGGYAFQFGNNSGDDHVQGVARFGWLDYSPEDLYEMWADVEIIAATSGAQLYVGVQQVDRAGNNLAGNGTFAYVTVSAVDESANIGRRVWRGYFRGVGPQAGIFGQASDPASPTFLSDGTYDGYGQGPTVRVRPIFLANYWTGSAKPGQIRIHGIGLRKVDDATVNWTGAWSSSTTYYRNDGVTYLGRSFAAKSKHTNQTPPSSATSNTYWYLVADKGTDGVDGADGDDGVDGVDGTDGKMVEFVWKRAASQPAAPTGNGIPSGWSDDPPAGSDPLWMSKVKQELDGTLVAGESWSTPIRHDGPPGTDGDDGDDGVSPIQMFLSTQNITIQANYSNVTKSGQVPRYVDITLKQGTTSILGSATINLTPSSGSISASYSAGVITISTANVAGYIDVEAVVASVTVATARIEIGRLADATPGESDNNVFISAGTSVGSSSGSFTVHSDTRMIRANASGQLIWGGGAQYAAGGSSTTGSGRMGFAGVYRAPGGGAWSYSGEDIGDSSAWDNSIPAFNYASVSLSETVSGLTADAYYEVGFAYRYYADAGTGGGASTTDCNISISR